MKRIVFGMVFLAISVLFICLPFIVSIGNENIEVLFAYLGAMMATLSFCFVLVELSDL